MTYISELFGYFEERDKPYSDSDFKELEVEYQQPVPDEIAQMWKTYGSGAGWTDDSPYLGEGIEGNFIVIFDPKTSIQWGKALGLFPQMLPFGGDGGSDLFIYQQEVGISLMSTDDYTAEYLEKVADSLEDFAKLALSKNMCDVL